MSFFDRYPKSYLKNLSDEEKQIKAVLGDAVDMRFRYQKTCGLFDLTYTVEDKYIVKFENDKTTRADLRRLAALTAILRADPNITFEVPDMCAGEYEIEPGRDVFALWYEKIDGNVLPFHQMDIYRCMGKEPRRAWNITMQQIGTFMAQLHEVPVTDVAHLFPNSVAGRVHAAVLAAVPALAAEEKNFRRRVFQNVLFAAYPDYDEVLCHNDLNPWNIALNKDHTIAGVFDWGMAAVNRPNREARFWEYCDEHVHLIEEAYAKRRGRPLFAEPKAMFVCRQKVTPDFISAVYKQALRER